MNLRNSITRNITYSNVTITIDGEDRVVKVYGETTPAREMKRLLKAWDMALPLPSIKVNTVTEQRAISIEDFIKNSTIINNESEEVK